MGIPRKLAAASLVAGAGAYAAAHLLRLSPPDPPLPPPGVPDRFAWRHADLFLTRRGAGPPALLLHDLYAGASGAEMAPLAVRLGESFETWVVDLPGFGRSDRPRMRYGPDLFFDAIVELVRHAVGHPTLLVGSGLSAAYAVEAATRLGNATSGVALLAPPEPEGPGILETPTWRPLTYQLLRSPIGELVYRARASASARRAMLRAALAVQPVDLEARAEDLHRYASQPDSWWPLWSLWAGDLQWDPRAALARLGCPAMVAWGARARSNPAAPETYRGVRPDLTQRVVPGTGRWPHVDAPEPTAAAIREWWVDRAAAEE